MATFNAWNLSLTSGMFLLAAAMALICIAVNIPKTLRNERAKASVDADMYVSTTVFFSAAFGANFAVSMYSSVLLADAPDWVAIAPLIGIVACTLYLVPVAASIATILARRVGEKGHAE